MRLHTKTALLVSAITLAMFLATLLLVSVRMINLIRENEKELSRFQALSLAEQISLVPSPRNQADLDRTISQARRARPNIVAVRVWKQTGGNLVEGAAAADGSPAEEVPNEIKAAMRRSGGAHGISSVRDNTIEKQRETYYRVFAPITEQGRFYGLVEVAERLDNIPAIVAQYLKTAALLALVAIVLTLLAVYALFRYLVYRPISELDEAIDRGSQLVKQVLSFARGAEGRRIPFNPADVIREVVDILRETFPKSVKIQHRPGEQVDAVLGDPTQLHQVLMNLCINARDALPNGGELEVTAMNVQLDEHFAEMAPEAVSNRCVMISVKDNGVGVSAQIIDKIFDPFFTTKAPGKGTGLGLSTSLGIVRSHGGFIDVESKEGSGACFKVYLPVFTAAMSLPTEGVKDSRSERDEEPEPPVGQGELVMVVDDEEPIRRITRGLLEAFGYRVVVAADGGEACALYREQQGEVSVALTDMMMPEKDGAAVIAELLRLDPQLPIIAGSGLAESGHEEQALALGARVFLAKPYTAEILLWTLGGTLSMQVKLLRALQEKEIRRSAQPKTSRSTPASLPRPIATWSGKWRPKHFAKIFITV